jgi:osmotically-inducible protein OsmY
MVRQQSTRAAITDGVITSKIKAALTIQPMTATFDIHVDTVASVVELSGFVETTEARDEALQVARDVEGVLIVNDSLDVRRIRPS